MGARDDLSRRDDTEPLRAATAARRPLALERAHTARDLTPSSSQVTPSLPPFFTTPAAAPAAPHTQLAAHAPELVAAHVARGDELVGHGRTNSERQRYLST